MEENKDVSEKVMVTLPAPVLAALIDMANSHIEDIETGIEDGTYLASENTDIDDKAAAVAAAEARYKFQTGKTGLQQARHEAERNALFERGAVLLVNLLNKIGIDHNNEYYLDDMPEGDLVDASEEIAPALRRAITESRLAVMCDEYADWNKRQGLDLGSADEHWDDPSLTEAQRAWVRDFSRRWDEVCDDEACASYLKLEAKRAAPADPSNLGWEGVINGLIKQYGQDGEHERYVRSDWQYEVANGDTNRGYWDWVAASIERDQDDEQTYTVNIPVQVTASSPAEAARLSLEDLRDPSIGPWSASVETEGGESVIVKIESDGQHDVPGLKP